MRSYVTTLYQGHWSCGLELRTNMGLYGIEYHPSHGFMHFSVLFWVGRGLMIDR
jgi:hypothetical protein